MTPDPPDAKPAPPSRQWSEVVLALGLIAGLVVLLSLNVGEGARPPAPAATDTLDVWLRRIVGWLAAVAELGAAAVIGWAVVQGLGTLALRAVRPGGGAVNAAEGVRLRLGRMLALGIEFTLASDILRTAVAPTRSDILTLGAIVLLRTLLNLFLEREIREGEARHGTTLTDAPARAHAGSSGGA